MLDMQSVMKNHTTRVLQQDAEFNLCPSENNHGA